MSAPATLGAEALAAARDAAFLRLLGLAFERPRGGWAAELRALAAEQGDPRLAALAADAARATEGQYLGVFGPGGTVSPREVAYRRMGDPGRMLSELSEFYRAFAYRPRAEDPADHIAVEVGFAGYLAMKEAYTRTQGDEEGTDRTRAARDLFLKTRLRPFAAGLGARLRGSGAAHLEAASRLLAEWAGCDGDGAAREDAAAMAPDPADDAPMSCGGCPGAGGGPDPDEPPAF